ncbi:MAG TPA: metalloregulator ArsR/SmtB family transcription factor [Solirubrobacteraceae bacterium]|jgi:DNA-binding transcriptional ArsR family regulator|nr:metalloregulator ArsR/SmtB family transcription factor [Solirubrobacteraceae bacterium]
MPLDGHPLRRRRRLDPADRLSAVFAALADPTRRAILTRLIEGEATVGELAAPFELSKAAVSRHIKVLADAGLVARTRLRTSRLSYLEPDALDEAIRWLVAVSDGAVPYRRGWDPGEALSWPSVAG